MLLLRVGPGEALRGSSRAARAGRERHRSQNVLVVAQVALALVLLVCAGLMMRSFAVLLNTITPQCGSTRVRARLVSALCKQHLGNLIEG